MNKFCEQLDKIFEEQLSTRLAFNVVDLFYEYDKVFPWTEYMPEDLSIELPCFTYEENGISLKHKEWDRYNKTYIAYESGITIIIELIHGDAKFKIKNNNTKIAETKFYADKYVNGPYLHELIIPRVKSARKTNNISV